MTSDRGWRRPRRGSDLSDRRRDEPTSDPLSPDYRGRVVRPADARRMADAEHRARMRRHLLREDERRVADGLPPRSREEIDRLAEPPKQHEAQK